MKEKDDLNKIQNTREIVNEIISFGVDDFMIKKIIDLLCLELEDTKTMRRIKLALNNENTEQKENKLIL